MIVNRINRYFIESKGNEKIMYRDNRFVFFNFERCYVCLKIFMYSKILSVKYFRDYMDWKVFFILLE